MGRLHFTILLLYTILKDQDQKLVGRIRSVNYIELDTLQ